MRVFGIVVRGANGFLAASEDAFSFLGVPQGDFAKLREALEHGRLPETVQVITIPLLGGEVQAILFLEAPLPEDLERCLKERGLFATILHTIPDHIYVKDTHHRFLFVNEAFARHRGFSSPEEMLGKTDFDLYPRELAERYWHEEEELLKTGKPIWNDEREVTDYSTGTPRKIWITTNKAPLYDQEGNVAGLVGVSRDITDRKMAEKALRASEEEKVLILNALEDQVVYYEEGPRIIWANAAVLRNFRLDPKDIVGKLCFNVFEGRETPCPGCATVRAFETGVPEEAEVTSRNGTIWHQRAYPILDAAGKVFRVVTVSLNITKRKKAEERIRYLTFHDPLTGLYNRLFFEEELRRLDVPRQLPLSVIMADVNNLKLVNDAFGHKKGDALLKRAAEILLQSCRREDIVARWGGDEFVILLPRTPQEVAESVMRRITRACEEASLGEEYHIPVSLAVGCATKVDEKESIDAVLSEAENRMYRNKLAEAKSLRARLILSFEQSLREIPGEMETHHERMRRLSRMTGEALGLSPAELDALDLLARLHDLGKLGVSRSILTKPAPLTQKEWEEVRRHPEIGYRIAQVLPELLPVAEGILAHHERFDGQGYPRGLKGKDIPLLARIVAVVDAFVAMTSDRPHRKALTQKEALEEIQRGAGTQFDPEIVKAFVKVVEVRE